MTLKARRGLTTRPVTQEDADAIAWICLGIFFVFCFWAAIVYRNQRP